MKIYGAFEHVDHMVASRAGRDDDTVNEALSDLTDQPVRLTPGAQHRKDREDEIVLPTALLNPVDQRRVVRVAEEFVNFGQHHETDQTTLVGHQRSSRLVGQEAGLGNDFLDPGADRGTNVGVVVQHPRHGGSRNPRSSPDLFERQLLRFGRHGR